MADQIQVVRRGTLAGLQPTPGLDRTMAPIGEDLAVAVLRAAPHTVPDWHHHSGRTAVAYVQSGTLRIEFGEGGRQSVDLTAGDFYLIPPGTAHRESNPGDEELVVVGVMVGPEANVVNVAGPDQR